MNAAASSLIDAIKASFSPSDPDWTCIPSGATSWYKYGGGGVNSWGSLCGVPNGCIAVLNLMGIYASFTDQIMYYACQTEFPITGLHDLWVADGGSGWSKEPVPDGEVLAYTTADSPLCHVSVSKWAYAAGVSMTEPTSYGTAHKTDRCAKVAAGIAAFTAGLLNEYIASNPIPQDYTMPDATATCYGCHYTGSVPAQQGKMDCETCHEDLRPHIEATSIPPTASHDPVVQTDFDVSFDDTSADNNGRPAGSLAITVNWGDGQVSTGVDGDTFTHTYVLADKYTIVHTAKDLGNLYGSEMIEVSVPEENAEEKYSITVNVVEDDGTTPIPGATIYLKQKKSGGHWKQIMYGYTDDDGSKIFENLLAGDTEYKVVVYKSSVDFHGNKKGKQSKVKFEHVGESAITLDSDKTITVQQGGEATNGPSGKEWKGNDGGAPDIDIT
jgi:hypothetical protein